MAESPVRKSLLPQTVQPVLAETKKLPMPDSELVRRAQQGDTPSFEELVRRYENKIYNLTYRMLGRDEDASEALQDTFMRAYRFLPKFEFKSSFYTWLYRIATNVSLTRLRKRRDTQTVSLDEPVSEEGGATRELPDEIHTPALDYRRTELRDAIQQAVDELPADYRPVIVLRDIEGLANQEVAEALDLSVAAVKSRLHRGRLLLREKLARYVRTIGS